MKADAESTSVTKFLQVIGQTHQHLHELAHYLRSCPEVKTAQVYPFMPGDMTQHHWDEEQRQPAIGSEFGVSAELHEGAVMDWWLNIRCEEDNGWFIFANVFKSDKDEDGCHSIAEFEEGQFLNFQAAMQRLSESITWLTERRALHISIIEA